MMLMTFFAATTLGETAKRPPPNAAAKRARCIFQFPRQEGIGKSFPFSLKTLAFASEQILLTLRRPGGRRSILNSIKVPIREFTLLPPGFRPLTFSESITASNFPKSYRYTRSQGIHVHEYIAEYNARWRRDGLNRNEGTRSHRVRIIRVKANLIMIV